MTAVGMLVAEMVMVVAMMVMVVAMAGTQKPTALVVQAALSMAAPMGMLAMRMLAVGRPVVVVVVVAVVVMVVVVVVVVAVVAVTDKKMAATLVAQAVLSVPVEARLVQALAGLMAPACRIAA
jgi:hypothetical protein